MPRPLPDPSPGTIARLREAAERLRTASAAVSDDSTTSTDSTGSTNSTVSTSSTVSTDYESWTLARLRRRATELDVKGRSTMDKAELIATLRALPETGDTSSGDA